MNVRNWPAKIVAALALLVVLGLIIISSGVLSLITGPTPPEVDGVEAAQYLGSLLN